MVGVRANCECNRFSWGDRCQNHCSKFCEEGKCENFNDEFLERKCFNCIFCFQKNSNSLNNFSDCRGYLDTSPCDSFACKNNGQCIDIRQTPYCNCTLNYNGDNCETEVAVQNPCRNFCYNGGICRVDVQQKPNCICIGQWEGKRCEQPPPCLKECGQCHIEWDIINECL